MLDTRPIKQSALYIFLQARAVYGAVVYIMFKLERGLHQSFEIEKVFKQNKKGATMTYIGIFVWFFMVSFLTTAFLMSF